MGTDEVVQNVLDQIERSVDKTKPWKDGYWGGDFEGLEKGNVWIVKGSIAALFIDIDTDSIKGRWTFGNFGKASFLMKLFTGISEYNLEIEDLDWVGEIYFIRGILHPDGTKVFFQQDGSKDVVYLQWYGEGKVKHLLDSVEHLYERSHPFKDQNVLDLIKNFDKTKPKKIANQPSLPKRQTRELRLPKIHPKYQPSLEGIRAISGRSIGAKVSYTV